MSKLPLNLDIELSGAIRGQSYICRIDGTDIELTLAELEILVDLIDAKLSTTCGLSFLPSVLARDKTQTSNKNHKHQLIYRLRRAINEALGKGMGHRIIMSGPRTSFYLNVPTKNISVLETVSELAPHHLPDAVVQRLLRTTGRFVSDV